MDTDDKKGKFKKWCSDHQIFTGIIGSLVATVIWTGLQLVTDIEQVIYIIVSPPKNETLSSMPTKNMLVLNMKLWFWGIIIIFLVSVIIGIGYFIGHKKSKMVSQDNIPQQDCNSCEKASDLTQANTNLQDKLKRYEEWDELIDKLKKYTQDSEIVDSVQLFTYSPLPSYTEIAHPKIVDISFHFEGGCTKSSANVNALHNMNYQFGYDVYEALIKLFKKRNAYYAASAYGERADKEIEKEIQSLANKIFNQIAELLNDIKDETQIEDTHYAYYRMLEVLTNIVLSPNEAIECRKLLVLDENIEKKLKTGQRTGMLGTLFVEATYSFCNENSITKSNRSYFSTPLQYKEKKLILLVVLERDKLRLGPNGHDDIRCCEMIYDQIANVLKTKSA